MSHVPQPSNEHLKARTHTHLNDAHGREYNPFHIYGSPQRPVHDLSQRGTNSGFQMFVSHLPFKSVFQFVLPNRPDLLANMSFTSTHQFFLTTSRSKPCLSTTWPIVCLILHCFQASWPPRTHASVLPNLRVESVGYAKRKHESIDPRLWDVPRDGTSTNASFGMTFACYLGDARS